MARTSGNLRCTLACWTMGAMAGLLAFILLRVIGGFDWTSAAFTGGLLAGLGGLLMTFLFCRPLPTLEDVKARQAARGASVASSGGLDDVARDADAGAVAAGDTTMPGHALPSGATSSVSPAGVVLTDGAELSEPLPGPAPVASALHETAGAEVKARAGAADAGMPTVAAPSDAGLGGSGLGGSGPASAGPSDAGISAPRLLGAADAGGADDLKRLRGIGPALEGVLNRLGIYHFHQIAAWTPAEIAWISTQIGRFGDVPVRQDWVGQAGALARGEEQSRGRQHIPGDGAP